MELKEVNECLPQFFAQEYMQIISLQILSSFCQFVVTFSHVGPALGKGGLRSVAKSDIRPFAETPLGQFKASQIKDSFLIFVHSWYAMSSSTFSCLGFCTDYKQLFCASKVRKFGFVLRCAFSACLRDSCPVFFQTKPCQICRTMKIIL